MKTQSLSDGRVPRKWHWHFRALQKLREHVVDDLCLRLAQAAKPIETPGMDSADSATDESDRILALSLLSGEEDVLHELDSAIRRIASGTYGTCERSGEKIPLKRLRAVPWTRFTKEAEVEIETERRTAAPDKTRGGGGTPRSCRGNATRRRRGKT